MHKKTNHEEEVGRQNLIEGQEKPLNLFSQNKTHVVKKKKERKKERH